MNSILIVNLDPDFRSAYSVLVAASLIKLNNTVKISIACVSDDLFHSLGIFENVYKLTESEFKKKDNSLKIKRKHPSLYETSWDFVINHSSNNQAAWIISDLQVGEVFGAYVNDKMKSEVSHNVFLSYLLSEEEKLDVLPCHISQIYSEIVNLYSTSLQLPSAWGQGQMDEVAERFSKLKNEKKKSKAILIDSGLKGQNNLGDMSFLLKLFKTIDQNSDYLPILYSKDVDADSFVITKLKEIMKEDMAIVSASDQGILGLLSNIDLVITDDINLKTRSDLSNCPSLYLSRNESLPMADFSIHPESLFYSCGSLTNEILKTCLELCLFIFKKIQFTDLNLGDAEVYMTICEDSRCTLAPLNMECQSSEFYSWCLSFRYISRLENMECPEVKINPAFYCEKVREELKSIKEIMSMLLERIKTSDQMDDELLNQIENASGPLKLALKRIEFKDKYSSNSIKSFLSDAKPAVKDLIDFLTHEEKVHSLAMIRP